MLFVVNRQTATRMLSRRLARAATATVATPRSTLVRLFTSTTTASSKKTPALADIHPENHESFNSKQKTFREDLVAAQKQQEASALRSFSPRGTDALGLGSLSTGDKERKKEFDEKDPPRKQGPLTNLIYGTKEGREHDAQLEASFSQVLARGKYVHSIVFHEVKPEKVDEYVELVGNWYPRMASLPENKVHLVGSWRTEVGDCDTFGTFIPPTALHPLADPRFWDYVFVELLWLTRCQFTSGNISATLAITAP